MISSFFNESAYTGVSDASVTEAPSVFIDVSIRVVGACSTVVTVLEEVSALADGTTTMVNKLRIAKVIMDWSFIVSFLEGACIYCDRGAQSKVAKAFNSTPFFQEENPMPEVKRS
jgi:hypothetical protein